MITSGCSIWRTGWRDRCGKQLEAEAQQLATTKKNIELLKKLKRLAEEGVGGEKGDKTMEIILDCGQWSINGYTIAGNYDDGYTVWKTEAGEDSETLYESNDFESCLVWCINS